MIGDRKKSKRPGANELTFKQKEIFLFIKDFIDNEGWPPSFREIAKNYGISVKATNDHIRAIERKGYIKTGNMSARAIKIIKGEVE